MNLDMHSKVTAEQVFAHLDYDNSGFITVEKLLFFVPSMVEEEVQALLRKLDRDADGRILLQDLKLVLNTPTKIARPKVQSRPRTPARDKSLTTLRKAPVRNS